MVGWRDADEDPMTRARNRRAAKRNARVRSQATRSKSRSNRPPVPVQDVGGYRLTLLGYLVVGAMVLAVVASLMAVAIQGSSF